MTAVEVFVGGYSPAGETGIGVFAFEEREPALRPIGGHTGVTNPSFIVLDADASHLYAVSECAVADDGVGGSVHAFRIERSAGGVDLVALGARPSGGDHPCHLAMHPSGGWISVANYSSGSVEVLPVLAGGGLGEPTALVQHEGSGPHPTRQEAPHAHSSVFSADGRYLIVADLGIDRVMVYSFDAGTLTLHSACATAPGAGPRHMAFTADGGHLLVVGELDNTLSAYRWADGVLEPASHVATLPDDAPETTSADLHVLGRHAFVSNRGHDSIAVTAFDPDVGLRLETIRSCGGSWPRGFGITPSGGHLLVGNRHSDELVLLPIDGADIGRVAARRPFREPSSVAFGRPLVD